MDEEKRGQNLEHVVDQPQNRKLPLDLTFIVNEPGKTLKDRFNQLINDCRYFDSLTAYFCVSGFYTIYKPLQNTEKIRILIGIATTRETYDLIKNGEQEAQQPFQFSHSETKQRTEDTIEYEMTDSEDNQDVEEGVQKFIEWIKEGKLQIRAYPSQNIHAKLYIMTFREGDRDEGRVITGSSNFTQSGLVDNLEFNVELKNRSDYEFAKQKFEELWENAVDVSENYIQTITERTWLNQNITPYELYLKFLYEYFKDELSRTDEVFTKYLPIDFKRFEYQEQAVLNAKKILKEYGGVFISDVVGLGKTYVSAMLAGQLDGRTLVIAPPALLNENNPGSWPNVFSDFHIPANFVSTGKLKEAKRATEQREYENVIIDESHRFRTETTISYEDIAEICRGKRVILVSATPYNNSPKDILAQIKLFQNTKKSTIPGVPDLEGFFTELEGRLKKVDRQKDYNQFLNITRSNAKEIRDKVLKYLMVRRTRTEIEKYFAEDLKRNNVKFPEVEDPEPFYYQLNYYEDRIFMQTVELITQKFKYARYTPLLYLKERISQLEQQSQRNMGGFMKVLLVKRLESSFYAFRKSIDRFIHSYEMFIKEYEKGDVYISKGYIDKIFELLEQGDDDAVHKLIEKGKGRKYASEDFNPDFVEDLKNDLRILEQIRADWQSIKRDPKLNTLLANLKTHEILKDKKIIIFTESKETAEYLTENINMTFGKTALLFHGNLSVKVRDEVIKNFDARARDKKDNYRILVSTEVLSEGVNLHRSNIVINYDIPWNPTRLMQRVGRVNRIDTPFDKIYTFNFFPTSQADSEIKLTNIARSKIEAFLTLLGGDSSILTEGEPISSHELFDKLLSKEAIIEDEEEESELKYLRIIEDIRDKTPEFFERIKRLPKKARSAKVVTQAFLPVNTQTGMSGVGEQAQTGMSVLLTFFRKGKLMKFFLSDRKNTMELDFLSAAKVFESSSDEKRAKLPLEDYYELLDKNKSAFSYATPEEVIGIHRRGGANSETKLLKILKATQKNSKQLTEEQEEYLKQIITRLEEGALPKQTVKKALNALDNLKKEIQNPLKVIGALQREISPTLLKSHYAGTSAITEGKREVILSLYLAERNDG
ncbi:MAG TPA: helicase-related protein [Candidatus Hydrothermia bacterium]|nr:helicase-related protein [Candidatus Hydrothermia bacterium]